MIENPDVYNMKQINKIHLLERVIPYLGMFLLAFLLWLPFSFKTTGLVEELGVTQVFEKGYSLFFVTPNSIMNSFRARPLQIFVHQLAYILDPNSYLYYNVFQMLFFWVKMVVVYWLVLEFLPGRKLIAFFIGILSTIYPSDTGLFTFRVIHIHSATVAYLLAFYLLIRHWRYTRQKSWLALAGAFTLLVFSLWQYQIALPFALLSPLVLLYFGRPLRRFIVGVFAWYGAVSFASLYALWASQQSNSTSYEGGIANNLQSIEETIQSVLQGLLLGYQRQTTGWLDAFEKLNNLPLFWPYLLLGMIIVTSIGLWLIYVQNREKSIHGSLRWQHYILLLVAGMATFAVGIAPYLPFKIYWIQDFRIYILGMVGSALTLTVTVYFFSHLLSKYRELFFLILMLPFWTLALLSAFVQHQSYVNYSLQTQDILQQIVTQAPEFNLDSKIVLIDQIGEFNNEYVLYHGVYFETFLRYLYNEQNLKAYFCIPNQVSLSDIKCNFDPEGVKVSCDACVVPATQQYRNLPKIPYEQLLIFVTEDNNKIKLLNSEEGRKLLNNTTYDPQKLITGTVPPFRVTTLFSCDPALACYREEPTQPTATYVLPSTGIIGLGWRPLEVSPEDGNTFRWSNNVRTTVNVNLLATSDLSLRFKMTKWLNVDSVDTLKLSLNGHDIPLTYESIQPMGRIYTASIPQSALAGYPSNTKLVFAIDKITPIPQVPSIYLGWAIGELTIEPTNP